MFDNENIGKGRGLEIEFFGRSVRRVYPDLERAALNPGETEKLSFPEALQLVFRGQSAFSWDPEAIKELSDPVPLRVVYRPRRKLLAEVLFQGVRSHLAKLVGEEKVGRLRLYRSVGSNLDFHFGIDGFFEWYGSMAPFDITANLVEEKNRLRQEKLARRPMSESEVRIEIVTGDMLKNSLGEEFQAVSAQIAQNLVDYSQPEKQDVRKYWGLGDGS